jgi:hypothetical protein
MCIAVNVSHQHFWEAVICQKLIMWFQQHLRPNTYFGVNHILQTSRFLGPHSHGHKERLHENKTMLIFFFISWGGVRLNPLGTSATNWPIVPARDDRWIWSVWWNENWQGKVKYSEKTCPSATLSTTNPRWSDLGSNPGRHGGKLATNRPSYGTAKTILK